jgi:hypothetical protein
MINVHNQSKYAKPLLCILMLFCCSITINAQHDKHIMSTDKPSTHGMLLLGSEKIYASHLAMFHPPHNYQIIFELELSKADKQKYVIDKNKNPKYTTYTIEPETFVLPDMVNHPKPFKVNLYRGHFERGGSQILKGITVKIVEVVYFKKFKVDEARSLTTDFIVFGNLKEQFLAHEITNEPDFEQIIEVKTNLNNYLKKQKFSILDLDNTQNNPIGVSGNEVNIDGNSILLLKQLYLEFNDLRN